MSARCLVCGTPSPEPRFAVDGYAIHECACGFGWVHPRPQAQELAAFYNDPAYYTGCEAGYADYAAAEPSHRRLARQRLARMEAVGARGRLIDAGCGPGYFLDEARCRGFTVAGVELSSEMRERCAALGLAVSETFASGSASDTLTMWEYIEHVPDPEAELRRAAEILPPGGVLSLSTPNAAHRLARMAPPRWPEYKPPAHLSFFEAASLVRLLCATGFEVVSLLHTSPVFETAGAADRGLDLLGRTCGTGRDRRTPAWPLYSLAYRLAALPATIAARFAAARYSMGLEVHARRR